MPADSIQKLIIDCRAALISPAPLGTETQATIDLLRARLDSIARDVAAAGANATEAQNGQWETQLKDLKGLLTAVQQLGNDGPTDPDHEMHKDFASNRRIYGIGTFAIVLTFLMIMLVLCQAHKNGPTAEEPNCGLPPEIACALPLVAIMGALGGLLNCIQSFGNFVGNRQFLRSWTLYYFLFPLKGAGLAIIVFLLVHTDLGRHNLELGGMQLAVPSQTNAVIVPAVMTTNNLVAGGSNTTTIITNMPASRIELVSKPVAFSKPEKPNLVMACLVAALTGMFANQAIEMLGSVFAIIFKKVEGKDAYQENPAKNSTGNSDKKHS